jgi:hypothetical protein
VNAVTIPVPAFFYFSLEGLLRSKMSLAFSQAFSVKGFACTRFFLFLFRGTFAQQNVARFFASLFGKRLCLYPLFFLTIK